MSKFKPGDIVYYMDGNALCQAVVCVEDDNWPIVEDGWCYVFNIAPTYGSRQWSHREDSSRYCDLINIKELYTSPKALIEAIKDTLRDEYVKKLDVLDSYIKGSAKKKQSLSGMVQDIILGRGVNSEK